MTGVNTHFFNPAEGGDPLLWQHLFWFFAHPEVYIVFVPATGFVSAILPTFARRKVFGYTALILANAAVAFIGFGVWVHHMFATPLPQLGQGLFTAASLLIAIPNGVQFFCWIATLWGGRPHVRMPMVFVLGFFATFLIGGLTGVMLASVSIDTQVHDTFFVVAHLHYVLIGGAIFPLFGAFYFWFPKWTGRMLGERLGNVELRLPLRRLPPHVLPDAPARPEGDAEASLHLRGGYELGAAQPRRDDRRLPDRRGCPAVPRQRPAEPSPGPDRRAGPVGRRGPWNGPRPRPRRATTSSIRRRSARTNPSGKTRPARPS